MWYIFYWGVLLIEVHWICFWLIAGIKKNGHFDLITCNFRTFFFSTTFSNWTLNCLFDIPNIFLILNRAKKNSTNNKTDCNTVQNIFIHTPCDTKSKRYSFNLNDSYLFFTFFLFSLYSLPISFKRSIFRLTAKFFFI